MSSNSADVNSSSSSSTASASAGAEQLCYIPCSFCSIILAVSVPCSSLFDMVTVRCGHCANLWSVNMASALQSLSTAWPHQQQQLQLHRNPPNYLQQQQQQQRPQLPQHDHRHRQHHHHHHHHQDLICLQGPRATTAASGRLGLAGANASLVASAGARCNKLGSTGIIRVPTTRVHELERPSMTNRQPEKKQRTPSAYNQFIREEIQRIKANNPEISHREAFSTAAKNWAHFPHIQFGLMLENNNQARLIGEGSEKNMMTKAAIFNN